jgi:hypothetical protein
MRGETQAEAVVIFGAGRMDGAHRHPVVFAAVSRLIELLAGAAHAFERIDNETVLQQPADIEHLFVGRDHLAQRFRVCVPHADGRAAVVADHPRSHLSVYRGRGLPVGREFAVRAALTDRPADDMDHGVNLVVPPTLFARKIFQLADEIWKPGQEDRVIEF